MIQKHTFDRVYDTQRVFRILLDCMSNPGRPGQLGPVAETIDAPLPNLLAVAATLLDNETSLHAIGAGMGKEIAAFTDGVECDIEQAGYLFVCDTLPQDQIDAVLSTVPCGTMESPEAGCTVVVLTREQDDTALLLTGPGVPPTGRLSPMGTYARQWIETRQRMEHLFPTGVDLIFLTPEAQVVAVPRLCGILEKEAQ